ncbi:chemotaxis protein CheX [Clostridium sp. OS1-26]|uniref:chemotaxis protein CheX n=1 Tax=Clostridium sp. OS1-26 TaxID=3070681 RepID=UPI0027E10FE0|nr:chemotaxis protein CheX [Clostridium sp. OS1-26]WML35705.1 chemotaxis protein CheX [Clostridium sp. OS1-26]
MKVEYIEPFIQASQNILLQIVNEEAVQGKLFLKDSTFHGDNVIIIIGIAGDVRGQVIFNLSQKSACSVVSKMMCGMPVSSLDDMAKSAICELANMISGNAATLFSEQKINLDITPPTIMIGDNIEISTTKSQSICVPLFIQDDFSFEINVSLSES